MQEPVLQICGLVKEYGRVRALDGVELDVPAGVVGLLGPNGAGKTTLLKLLLGLLRPTAGAARIAGLDPRRRRERLELRRRVGFLPEGDCLLPGTTAVSLVMTLGRLTGLRWEDAMTRAHEVLDYVGLEEARYREVGEYSTGMKQRLKLAQALVHDPPLLLLDEPTNGLDPKGRRHMLDLVRDLGHVQGKSILLCSHLLPDVERTCEHVIVLHRGKVVADGALAELTHVDELTMRVRVQAGSSEYARALADDDRKFDQDDGGAFRIDAPAGTTDADDLFALAARAGTTICELHPVRSTLEEVFLRVLRESQDG